MDWNIRQAKERFSELVREAAARPQKIYHRDQVVAAVVDAETLDEFLAWKGQREGRHAALTEAFAKLPKLRGTERPVQPPTALAPPSPDRPQ